MDRLISEEKVIEIIETSWNRTQSINRIKAIPSAEPKDIEEKMFAYLDGKTNDEILEEVFGSNFYPFYADWYKEPYKREQE